MHITIINTGAANLASVRAAFERLNCRTQTTEAPDDVLAAPAVVLPGVGAFGPAMQRLRDLRIDTALRARISGNKPTLAICLGLQLLLDASEESPGVAGLSIIPGTAVKFPNNAVRVPHMGWNTVRVSTDAPAWPWPTLIADAYFANSYRLSIALGTMPEWSLLTSEYAGTFVAAFARGSLLACQFHPELSGAFGHSLLQRWLDIAKANALGDQSMRDTELSRC